LNSKLRSIPRIIFDVIKIARVMGRQTLNIRYAYFVWVFPFEMLDLLIALFSWYFFALTFGGRSELLAPYGGDFISYLILGIVFNRYLGYNIGQIYCIIQSIYAPMHGTGVQKLSFADHLVLFNVSLSKWVAARIIWDYLMISIRAMIYIIIGFGLGMKSATFINYPGFVLVFILGLIATIGIGLISASMYWIIGVYRGREPIQWFIHTFSGLVSGVYFPPEILPEWLYKIGLLFPQTYALRALRLALVSGYPLEKLLPDISILTIQCIFLLPLGIMCIRYSLELARRKGTLIK